MLTLMSALCEMFGVQLYKNNARALLSHILSILNFDWLQHARSVRGVYDFNSNLSTHLIVCHLPIKYEVNNPEGNLPISPYSWHKANLNLAITKQLTLVLNFKDLSVTHWNKPWRYSSCEIQDGLRAPILSFSFHWSSQGTKQQIDSSFKFQKMCQPMK